MVAIIKRAGFALFAGVAMLTSAFSQELTGYEIMKRADDVDSGDTASYVATMTILNKRGTKRVREVVFYSKEVPGGSRTVIVFRTPKDVAGVGYLMWDYDEDENGNKKDSDNWLYMPAAKKVRRISGSEGDGDFMGTDFTYDDMGERGLHKDTFTLLGSEIVGGEDCWKVECVANDQTEKNPRRILWIIKSNYMLVKGEFYNRQNELARVLICDDIKQIDGIWTTGKMNMSNVKTGHSTTIEMTDVRYNEPMNDSIFTVSSLERGTVR